MWKDNIVFNVVKNEVEILGLMAKKGINADTAWNLTYPTRVCYVDIYRHKSCGKIDQRGRIFSHVWHELAPT
jgi:hypothetical protein